MFRARSTRPGSFAGTYGACTPRKNCAVGTNHRALSAPSRVMFGAVALITMSTPRPIVIHTRAGISGRDNAVGSGVGRHRQLDVRGDRVMQLDPDGVAPRPS